MDPIKSQPNVGKYTIISASFFGLLSLLCQWAYRWVELIGGVKWTDRSISDTTWVERFFTLGVCWVGTVIEKKMANPPYILVDMDPLLTYLLVLASHLFLTLRYIHDIFYHLSVFFWRDDPGKWNGGGFLCLLTGSIFGVSSKIHCRKAVETHVKAKCLHGTLSGYSTKSLIHLLFLAYRHGVCQDGRRVPCLFLPFQHVTWDASGNVCDGPLGSPPTFFTNCLEDGPCTPLRMGRG